MNTWAIVAIPDENDYVWRLSSEKIPHMTLLFLGEQDDLTLASEISEFLGHVAEETPRFGLSVDHRGTLGPEDADVLFFSEESGQLKRIEDVRSALLKHDSISKLYLSTEQYPQWTPHLTMGYPETPAKPDTRDYPGISWISFNKLAFWTEDDDGVEFLLKERNDLAMGAFDSEQISSFLKHKDFSPAKRKTLAKQKHALPDGSYPIENVADLENAIQHAEVSLEEFVAAFPDVSADDLLHWGVKGMHWGIRKQRGAYRVVSTDAQGRTKKEQKKAAKVEVGKRQGPKGSDGEPISKQSTKARKAAKEDINKLTDAQLRERLNRIKMEQEYARLTAPQKSAGQKFIQSVLADSGKQVATKFVTDNANNAVAKLVTPRVSDVVNKQAIKAGQRAAAGSATKSLAKTLAEAAAKVE